MTLLVFVGGMAVGWVQMFLLLDWYTKSGQFYYSPPKRRGDDDSHSHG